MASDGDLAVRARLNARKVFNVLLEITGDSLTRDLLRTHWQDYEVRPMQLAFKPEQVYTLRRDLPAMDDGSACSLKVHRSQVEKLPDYPALSPLNRKASADQPDSRAGDNFVALQNSPSFSVA